jgi:hypothetical protein
MKHESRELGRWEKLAGDVSAGEIGGVVGGGTGGAVDVGGGVVVPPAGDVRENTRPRRAPPTKLFSSTS